MSASRRLLRIARPLLGLLLFTGALWVLRRELGPEGLSRVPDELRSLPPGRIADAANRIGIPSESASNVEAALSAVKALRLETPPRILIGGSLYLAGDVLRRNGTLPE